MKKYQSLFILISTLIVSSYSYSQMHSLADEELESVEGQAGADLSLKLNLNHTSAGQLDTVLCSDLRFCRLGLSLSNRYHDGTFDTINADGSITPPSSGRKQWVVLKGIQGTVNIPLLKLDGEDIQITGQTTPKAAIKLGFDRNKPIEIRNLGFDSMSVETDTCTENNTNCSTGTANLPGYLTPVTTYGGTGFDANREHGFVGMKINTNLSINGNIKIFSCGSTHPRC